MSKELSRNSYLSKNTGNYPEKIGVAGRIYVKAEDLRYGTNPHQTAAFYRQEGKSSPIGGMRSSTNQSAGRTPQLLYSRGIIR
jgi:phosphoribosylaminoimidazolecarboxamide formyltransferase/IMP cyclohydrolase